MISDQIREAITTLSPEERGAILALGDPTMEETLTDVIRAARLRARAAQRRDDVLATWFASGVTSALALVIDAIETGDLGPLKELYAERP